MVGARHGPHLSIISKHLDNFSPIFNVVLFVKVLVRSVQLEYARRNLASHRDMVSLFLVLF